MNIRLFEARCAACRASFAKPELGDFAYGSFIFTGVSGTVHAYFEAIENPVWKRAEGFVPTLTNGIQRGDFLLAACAHFADPVGGQRLTADHVCPKCRSHELASWAGQRMGEAEIPEASFRTFLSLAEADRLREIAEFKSGFEAQQCAASDASE
ncbi:hypothetical protein [Steroidobacter cummioxidans]|uniref:hypothetical protein n=1 Tax=Steroidobacter cummioxidans TaxID=1803913 RepID=UPI000E3211DD|nr:hypothetical protein [Steroidobacter cummioxidans]